MPIKKQHLKSKPEVKVTFEVSKEACQGAVQVFLLAEFNDWAELEMKALKSGSFKLVVNIAKDQQLSYQYKFKFCMPDGSIRFDNDWQAEAYVANEFGEENSLLNLE
ncbi:1,4-alpha-glucan branching protein [Alginatibacterium sediminis]|uniref:1,4-alpha-glucan branching protein n=1 Tax=Alginatibacterium sediminis TaxID=2164068 RepID=A0A420EJL1_9ALTE|nr:isoamylase early set domain-containing protein [Alginatibacterium sediminis]RKF20911.1 1,4-alpha-glucan branching protein [Alginatibacterium sediminis]